MHYLAQGAAAYPAARGDQAIDFIGEFEFPSPISPVPAWVSAPTGPNTLNNGVAYSSRGPRDESIAPCAGLVSSFISLSRANGLINNAPLYPDHGPAASDRCPFSRNQAASRQAE